MNCCEKLSQAISASQLRDLDLSNNQLRDAGLQALWRGLKEAQLDSLRWVLSQPPFQVTLRICGFCVQAEELQPDARQLPAPGQDHQLRLGHAQTAGPL